MVSQHRLDAADSYFLTEQLRATDPTKYYHLVPGIVGRRILPVISGVSPNKPVHAYDMYRVVASKPRSGTGRSRGAPTVAVVKTKDTQNIDTFEETATWTVDEIRAAREAGEDLPQDTISAAVVGLEQRIDECLAIGNSLKAIPGFANNSAIPSSNAAAAWSGATADQILADVTALVQNTSTALKQGQIPGSALPAFNQFSLVLPAVYEVKWYTTPRSATSDHTISSFVEEKFKMIKSVHFWHRLDTANGGNPMSVLAPALDNGAINPFAGGALIPLDFEMLPEQYDGRSVNSNCAAKCGGFVARYPVAFRYLKSM